MADHPDNDLDPSDTHGPHPPAPAPKPKTSALKGTVLGAAMLGLGEVLEPEKTNTDVVIETTVDKDDDLGKKFDLDFGDLDGLEPQTGSDIDTDTL